VVNVNEQSAKPFELPVDQYYPDATYLNQPGDQLSDRPLVLIREALLFNEDAYRTLRDHASPLGRGALVLLIIVGITATAQAVGLAFGLLTSPRIDILQDNMYEYITQMGLYSRRVAASPDSVQQFRQTYEGIWQLVRLLGGYPSWSGTLATVFEVVVGSFVSWLVYGVITHWTARWFRGRASLKQFMGPLALSYAPLLLTVVLLVPGAAVAMPLVFLALLVAKYQAVKTTYGLSPLSSLSITVLPYFFVTLLLIALAVFGIAYEVARIPYLEPIIRGLKLIRMF
jgi:hypothetical protein